MSDLLRMLEEQGSMPEYANLVGNWDALSIPIHCVFKVGLLHQYTTFLVCKNGTKLVWEVRVDLPTSPLESVRDRMVSPSVCIKAWSW